MDPSTILNSYLLISNVAWLIVILAIIVSIVLTIENKRENKPVKKIWLIAILIILVVAVIAGYYMIFSIDYIYDPIHEYPWILF